MSKNLDIARSYTDSEINTSLGLKANIASPTFTGTVLSNGNIEGTTISGTGYGLRIKADTTNTDCILQFTNNPVTVQWGSISSSSNGNMSLNPTSGQVYFGALNNNVNGYSRLNNGLILQWGIYQQNNGTDITITYPLAFNTVFYVSTSMGSRTGGADMFFNGIAAINVNTSNFISMNRTDSNSNWFRWIALGN